MLPSAAGGDFDFEVTLMVEIEFSKKACPVPVNDHLVADDEPDEPDDASPAPASAPEDYEPAAAPGSATTYDADVTAVTPAPAPAAAPGDPGPAVPCTVDDVFVGCGCGSAGGGNGLPDNPREATGLCCDAKTKVTVEGSQMSSSAWCVEYSPPPRPPPRLPPPPSPPPNDVCSKQNMVAGCKCASQGFGHGLPDNPSSTSPLCCDKATKMTVTGAQITSFVTCVEYSPPPRPPPPLPPPPRPPPHDVCSKDNMVAGCKCASQGFGHGKPDNPSSTSPLCCDKATKRTAKGAQITSWVTCVQYSPPPRPPPPLPPPPSPPPNDICSTGNFFEGCKKCGITRGKNCPPVNSGLCCHKASKVAVKGARSMSSRWCGTSVGAPTRRLLAAPASASADEASLAPGPSRRLLAPQSDAAQAAAAAAATEECKLKLDSVAVELDFTVQKNQPVNSTSANANASKPMFKIEVGDGPVDRIKTRLESAPGVCNQRLKLKCD
jgi:hypothetical protein